MRKNVTNKSHVDNNNNQASLPDIVDFSKLPSSLRQRNTRQESDVIVIIFVDVFHWTENLMIWGIFASSSKLCEIVRADNRHVKEMYYTHRI